jgi:hypothetical protein
MKMPARQLVQLFSHLSCTLLFVFDGVFCGYVYACAERSYCVSVDPQIIAEFEETPPCDEAMTTASRVQYADCCMANLTCHNNNNNHKNQLVGADVSSGMYTCSAMLFLAYLTSTGMCDDSSTAKRKHSSCTVLRLFTVFADWLVTIS